MRNERFKFTNTRARWMAKGYGGLVRKFRAMIEIDKPAVSSSRQGVQCVRVCMCHFISISDHIISRVDVVFDGDRMCAFFFLTF